MSHLEHRVSDLEGCKERAWDLKEEVNKIRREGNSFKDDNKQIRRELEEQRKITTALQTTNTTLLEENKFLMEGTENLHIWLKEVEEKAEEATPSWGK